MLIITAGSDNYLFNLTINYCGDRASEYGYEFLVYDLGGLERGYKINDPRCASRFRKVKSAMKPELILHALENTVESMVVWIDGDATLIRPIDEVDDGSFDVAVTVRPKCSQKKTHYINAGVIFVKNNTKGRTFIKAWVDAMPQIPALNTQTKPLNYSDQQTLEERILLPNIDTPFWDSIGRVYKINGVRIKLLDCERYNNFWLMRTPITAPSEDTKILHFKGHKMHRLSSYHERFLV